MNTYKTSEVADIIGIHPNTVRLYEELGLITRPDRQPNGYRIFTDLHIEQFKLARVAFKVEVLQNGLRKKVVEIVKATASCNFNKALCIANEYLTQLSKEQDNAEEAIESVNQFLCDNQITNDVLLKRKETADYLLISVDTLRNWEMNGLLTVKRKANGYRVYTQEDISRLKMIHCLRCANYSLESILRMLNALSDTKKINVREVLNTPRRNDDIISACDRLITSLHSARVNANVMISHIKRMKSIFENNK